MKVVCKPSKQNTYVKKKLVVTYQLYIVDSSVHKKNKDNLNLHRLIPNNQKENMHVSTIEL